MKKINPILFLTPALLLASLVGCNSKSDGGKKVIQIGVACKGYRSTFANDLVNAFNKKHDDVSAKIVYTGPDANYQDNRLQLKNNQVDLIFTLTNTVFATQINKTIRHWADLSDIYESPLEGYKEADGSAKIKDYIDRSFYNSFTFTDGKQYAIPFTSGVVGLLYNKTKWDSTNTALRNGGKDELVLPKTTTEMFTLFERIKTTDVKNASGGAYAFSYSGVNSYMHFMFNSLWPQYLGANTAENFFKGQDEHGVYTADIYKSDARLYSYDTIRKMILSSNGYVSEKDIGLTYDLEQLSFLRGNSLFSCNGDWMEAEASKQFNPGEADVELIRTPVLSEIVKNPEISSDFTGSDATKDKKLSSIVSLIDTKYIEGDDEPNESDASSLAISLNTLKFVYHARLVRHTLPDFTALIPEYSKELTEAKDFLKFMLSKEGQEIVMNATYGCSSPLTIDYSQMEYYQIGTAFTKSRLNIIRKSLPYGNANNYPMEFLAGCKPCDDLNIANGFGGKTPKSANDFMMNEYNNYATTWASKMALAGVKN